MIAQEHFNVIVGNSRE